MASTTAAGTTLAICAALPATETQAGFSALALTHTSAANADGTPTKRGSHTFTLRVVSGSSSITRTFTIQVGR